MMQFLPQKLQLQQEQQQLQLLGAAWQPSDTPDPDAAVGRHLGGSASSSSTAVVPAQSSSLSIRDLNKGRSNIAAYQITVTEDQLDQQSHLSHAGPAPTESHHGWQQCKQQEQEQQLQVWAELESNGWLVLHQRKESGISAAKQQQEAKAAKVVYRGCSRPYQQQQAVPQIGASCQHKEPVSVNKQDKTFRKNSAASTSGATGPGSNESRYPPSANLGAAPGGTGQQAQRKTGLSHRQRYRRKQWELQQTTELGLQQK